jgi:DNA-binding transcriptional ArsR family regulator
MNGEHRSAVRKRRRQAEIQQLVADFTRSGLKKGEFCRRHDLTWSTLNRHLKKLDQKRPEALGASELVAVELHERDRRGGLAVVVSNGRRIEVQRGFDEDTLERLTHVLERM